MASTQTSLAGLVAYLFREDQGLAPFVVPSKWHSLAPKKKK